MTTAPPPAITLTTEQLVACDQIAGWLDSEKPYFTLGGYAGTGKSTILKHLVSSQPGRVAVCAPTGKAAQVLRRKGLTNAKTIHSTIYHCDMVKGKPVFWLRPPDEVDWDLMVVDEASMVSREIFDDIMKLKRPVLFVGDHGQLEPVGDSPNLMHNPDARLETIHRQAKDSPIITFAHELRQGVPPSRREKDGLRVLPRAELPGDLTTGQIITTFNRSRVAINNLVRRAKGLENLLLEKGERIICLRNNKELGVFNGQMFDVLAVDMETPGTRVYAEIRPDGEPDEAAFWVEVDRDQFGKEKTKEFDKRAPKDVGLFDYAYAITCHKAQGSEFDHVIVFDEPGYVPWTRSRWRYTSSTRAAKQLTYLFS